MIIQLKEPLQRPRKIIPAGRRIEVTKAYGEELIAAGTAFKIDLANLSDFEADLVRQSAGSNPHHHHRHQEEE